MSDRAAAGAPQTPTAFAAGRPPPLGHVILCAFAFPPLRLPMSACVAMMMAAFRAHGIIEMDRRLGRR